MSVKDNAKFTFSSYRKSMRDMAREMQKLADTTNLTREQIDSINSMFDARQELLERLNIRLRGGDPGPSLNWRGEDGLR